MEKKVTRKRMLLLLTVIVAIFSGLVMSGAISFNGLQDSYQSYWEGRILESNLTITDWTSKMLDNDRDVLVITLNATSVSTDTYTIVISTFDYLGYHLTNSTRIISYTADVPQDEMFTLVRNNLITDYQSILIDVTR